MNSKGILSPLLSRKSWTFWFQTASKSFLPTSPQFKRRFKLIYKLLLLDLMHMLHTWKRLISSELSLINKNKQLKDTQLSKTVLKWKRRRKVELRSKNLLRKSLLSKFAKKFATLSLGTQSLEK